MYVELQKRRNPTPQGGQGRPPLHFLQFFVRNQMEVSVHVIAGSRAWHPERGEGSCCTGAEIPRSARNDISGTSVHTNNTSYITACHSPRQERNSS